MIMFHLICSLILVDICTYIYIYIYYVCMYVCIYIYIWRERERERFHLTCSLILVGLPVREGRRDVEALRAGPELKYLPV